MGNCMSAQDSPEKAVSDAIDRQLEADSRRLRMDCKILLLGSGESGKSAIVDQMKIIHQNGFTDEELTKYRPIIYRNTLDSAQAIVFAMRKMGYDYVDPNNRVNADYIFDYRIDESTPVFSSEIAQAIHQLWNDPVIPKLMDHSSEFHLMDNAVYFFTQVLRIGSPYYCPTEDDILRARKKTTSITETRFAVEFLHIRMFDVCRPCSGRWKWIHCSENVTSIIFCTALDEYDQVSLGKNQNRLTESLILFESVINSRWFRRTSIILFLSRIDAFKTKLTKVPLERYFPEYSGGADVNKAAKYILWRFAQTNRARLSIYPHLIEATGTTNMRLVVKVVKETIRNNALEDSGIRGCRHSIV